MIFFPSSSVFNRNQNKKSKMISALVIGTAVISLVFSLYGCSKSKSSSSNSNSTRTTQNINQGWTFTKDSVSSTVDLPHTWNASDGSDGGNNYYQGTCSYTKNIDIPSSYKGKNIVLRFGAVNKLATVYVNNAKVGQHLGGYSAFTVNISNAVMYGKTNSIEVDVNNTVSLCMPTSGDYTQYGGIYRDITLIATGDTYIDTEDYASSGIKILSKGSDISGISADGSTATSAKITVTASIRSLDPSFVATATVDGNSYTLDKTPSGNNDGKYTASKDITLTNVTLWNGLKNPHLYPVDVTVTSDQDSDTVSAKIGIRKLEYTVNGTYLNGVSYPLRGVNTHQDMQGYGNAVPWEVRKNDIVILKELGANVVRVAHYPHVDEVYTACDELGVVVYAEVPCQGTMTYTDAYKTNAVQQIAEFVKQECNHPSIGSWGVGNELGAGSTTDQITFASATIKAMSDKAREIDPTRYIAQAGAGTAIYTGTGVWAWNVSGYLDVAAVHMYYGWYDSPITLLADKLDALHTAYPTIPLGLSEYGAGANVAQHQVLVSGYKPSGFGDPNHPEEYQSYVHEQNWLVIAARPWLWESTVWNLFDFGSDSRNEGSLPGLNDKGLVTYDHQTKKDAFYFYKAQWNTSTPFVYITDRRYTSRSVSNNPVTIKVYSNCTNVTLNVNGTDCGAGTLQQNGVFVWSNITLAAANTVVATGISGTNTVTDTVSAWTVASLWNNVRTQIATVIMDLHKQI
jgi:beta-galactosidase